MASESVILTALPNGVHDDGRRLRVTVFVSPRLSTDGRDREPLSAYAAFRRWPDALAELGLRVEFDGVGPVSTDPDPDFPSADLSTWELVFDPDRVAVLAGRDQPKDLSKRRMLTFPANSVAEQVLSLYTDVAMTTPTAFPPATGSPLTSLARRLGPLSTAPDRAYALLDEMIAGEQGPAGKGGRYLVRTQSQPPELAFAQAYRFYDRPQTRDPVGPDRVPDPPKPPEYDFHGYVAALGDYPHLLRLLGLAIDLVVDRPGNLARQGRVRIHVEPHPRLGFVTEEAARPWTAYQLDPPRFLPRPRERGRDLADGTLRLEDDKVFGVHQIDVDGSALKTVDFAANVARLGAHLNARQRSMSEDAAALPALRTGGFVVTRDDRAAAVVGQLDQAAAHESGHAGNTAVDLFAEDVTRGYRPDAADAVKLTWRSLCARVGEYVVGPQPIPGIPPDEGFVKGSSTTSLPANNPKSNPDTDDLYLHEAVFGWDGWSLSVRRPGDTIADDAGAVGQPPASPDPDLPLETSFTVLPGSLPRLRFGRAYRFRARAVDLAGNSVRDKDVVDTHVSRGHTFRRFDPVPSPAVIPRRPFGEGESLLRLVVRSTLDVLPAAYVADPRITGLAGHTDPRTAYLPTNERHLAPPLSSVQLAEWHGMFDPAIGGSAAQSEVDSQFAVAAREKGSFIVAAPGAFVVNPDPTATPSSLPAARTEQNPLKPGEYVCIEVDNLALPYLPDVLSAGASFTRLPGDAATRTEAWLGGDWPDRKPMRIRIADGGETGAAQQAPQWNPATRVLTVFLRQAELVTVRLSSFPIAERLDELGIWMAEPAGTRTVQEPDAKAGRHWMLTPYQELTLVHAVEKPLTAPTVNVAGSGVQRTQGETFAVLAGTIGNHAKSTGRLDIEAEWTEPVDDLGKAAPNDAENLGELARGDHVADFLLEPTENACRTGRDDVPPVGTPAVHRVRHEFRDTKHRLVSYHAVATTRFREYFPPEITDRPELITHAGPALQLSVPSSRRPDPPEVLYVVPTFSWQEQSTRGLPDGMTVDDLPPKLATALRGLPPATRRALARGDDISASLPAGVRLPPVVRRTRRTGLRVYLNRPWYSSGAGELLAVVVPDQAHLGWPIDVLQGIEVSAVDRIRADELAEQILATGVVKPKAGGARLSAAERLVRTVQQFSPEPGTAAALSARVEGSSALTAFQSSRFSSVISDAIGHLLATGDPEDFVTRWGRDPIWGSDPPLSGPFIHQFPLRSAVGTGLALAEAPGHTVAAIGHRPRYDTDRELWYCDIDIDAGPSYFPFVRLGLARYQSASIPGQQLSRVVTPEWTQLVAERTVSLSKVTARGARVTLRGPGGYTDLAESVLGGAAATTADGMALSRFAVAQVERLPAGATTDLAWVDGGDEVRLGLDVPDPYADVRYTGSVPVPVRATGEQLRLSVREYEILPTDEPFADDHFEHTRITGVDFTGPPTTPIPVVHQATDRFPVHYRLVYADHLPL